MGRENGIFRCRRKPTLSLTIDKTCFTSITFSVQHTRAIHSAILLTCHIDRLQHALAHVQVPHCRVDSMNDQSYRACYHKSARGLLTH